MDIHHYWKSQIRPVLEAPFETTPQSSNDQDFPPLRAACLKFITIFRSHLPDSEIGSSFQHIQRHMQHPSAVVHTYAAHTIDKLLASMRPNSSSNSSANVPPTVPRFNPQELKPILCPMVDPVLAILIDNKGIEQNEYLMRLVVRCLIVHYIYTRRDVVSALIRSCQNGSRYRSDQKKEKRPP